MPRRLRIGHVRAVRMSGDGVTYSISGQSASLKRGLRVSAAQRAYSVIGQDAAFNVDSSGAVPLSLAFDDATPHQISISAPQTRTLAAGTTANVYYRVTGGSTWTDGGRLYYIDSTNVAHGGGAVAGFAGWVLGCTPGTQYDVRVDVTESGVTTTTTTTHTTRSLPTEGSAQTGVRVTTATFAARMAAAVAGDVLVLDPGTYTLSGFSWTSPGTSSQPVVIRGASRDSVILTDSTGVVLNLAGGYFVIEHLTIRGSQSDGAGASVGIAMSGARHANVTVRHCKFDGCDRAFKAFDPIDGLLFYDNELVGNNAHLASDAVDDGRYFNDDGVGMPGHGNCVWNCTFSGHGDVIKLTDQTHVAGLSRACYAHHNWVKWSGDDFFEADDAGGNLCAYNNIVCNTATAISAADNYGGPVGLVRNVFINQMRHPLKLNGNSFGARIWSNTWVQTVKKATGTASGDFGMYCPNGGTQYGFDYRNNLLTWRGAGAYTHILQFAVNGATFDYNAHYPDRSFVLGSYNGASLAAFAASGPVSAHDIITELDPFATNISLGANYTTRYDGHVDATLDAASSAKGAGVAIPGVTDGYTGAAPDIGAVIAGQSFGAVGCDWASAVPGWAANQASQTWAAIPGSALSSVDPDPGRTSAWAGSSGQTSVVDAWNGAAFDPSGRMWLTALGGHSNYFGNEVYCWNLNKAAPDWTLVLAPSNLGSYSVASGTASLYSDGRPRSSHSYNTPVYIPGVGPAIAGMTSRTPDGGSATRAVYRFNEATGAATFGAEPSASGSSTGAAACFDSTRGSLGSVWRRWAGTSVMQRYDVAADSWTNVGSAQAYASAMSMAYYPGADLILLGNGDDQGGGQSFQWGLFDCAAGTYHFPTFTGAPALGVAHTGGLWPGDCQPVWVAALGCFCAWDNSTSRTLITTITPPASSPKTNAWTVSTLPVSGANTVTPSAAAGAGTYGRFAYWPAAGGFVLLNSNTEAGYFYKV